MTMEPTREEEIRLTYYLEDTNITSYNVSGAVNSTTTPSRSLSYDGLSALDKGVIGGGVLFFAILVVSHGVLCWRCYRRSRNNSCGRPCRGGCNQASKPSSAAGGGCRGCSGCCCCCCKDLCCVWGFVGKLDSDVAWDDSSDNSSLSSIQSIHSIENEEEAANKIPRPVEKSPEKASQPSINTRSPASNTVSVVHYQATHSVTLSAEPSGQQQDHSDPGAVAGSTRCIVLTPSNEAGLNDFEQRKKESPHQQTVALRASADLSQMESRVSSPLAAHPRLMFGEKYLNHGFADSQSEHHTGADRQGGDAAQEKAGESVMHFRSVRSRELSTVLSSKQSMLVSGEEIEGRCEHQGTPGDVPKEMRWKPSVGLENARSQQVVSSISLAAESGCGEEININVEHHMKVESQNTNSSTRHTANVSTASLRSTLLEKTNSELQPCYEENRTNIAQTEIILLHEEKRRTDSHEKIRKCSDPERVHEENRENLADIIIVHRDKPCANSHTESPQFEGYMKQQESRTLPPNQTGLAERMTEARRGLNSTPADPDSSNRNGNKATGSESTTRAKLPQDNCATDSCNGTSCSLVQEEKEPPAQSVLKDKVSRGRRHHRRTLSDVHPMKQFTAVSGTARAQVGLPPFLTPADETRNMTTALQTDGAVSIDAVHVQASEPRDASSSNDCPNFQAKLRLLPPSDKRPVKKTPPPFPNLIKFVPFPKPVTSFKVERRGSFGGFSPAQRPGDNDWGEQASGGKPSLPQPSEDDSDLFRPRSRSTGALPPNDHEVLMNLNMSAEEQFPIEIATHFDDIVYSESDEEGDKGITLNTVKPARPVSMDRCLQKKRAGECIVHDDLCRSSLLVTIHEEDVSCMPPLVPPKP